MRTSSLLIAVSLSLLVGCGRSPDKEKSVPTATAEPAATGSQTPADAAPAEATPVGTSPAALVFRVMREGGGGIDATINQVSPKGEITYYATVPGTGEKALDKPCDSGQRFQAEPKIAAFLRGPTQDCASKIEFMFYSTQATLQFIKRGEDASTGGDFLVAQSNYGTAADRLEYADPEKARHLRVLSTVAAGRVLGVGAPVQGDSGNEKPSSEFKDRVRIFQRENGIQESGVLDARTRESISRMKIENHEMVVPPAASATPTPANAAAIAAAPALVMTPQTAAPALEVHMSAAQMLAVSSSPHTAEMIHANIKHFAHTQH